MLKGFQEFITKGSAIDLAVGVVIGAAFTAVVNAVVKGFIMPIVALIFGKPNFDTAFTPVIFGTSFPLGTILTALVNFLCVAAALYFVIVLPMNKIRAHRASSEEEVAPEPTELDVLKNIESLLSEQSSR